MLIHFFEKKKTVYLNLDTDENLKNEPRKNYNVACDLFKIMHKICIHTFVPTVLYLKY